MTDPNDLTIDRRAGVDRRQLDATSWVDVVPRFVRDADAQFRDVHDSARWQQTEVLRYDKYVPERRLGTALRADGSPMLRQIDLHLRSAYRMPFTGVGALLYRNGDDFQGLHSDREMRWLDDTLIAIVVLGQRRPFVIRRRAPMAEVVERVPAGAGPDDIVLLPGEGDMLVMGGACQRDWLHGVPAFDTPDPRISLTWRWTSRRGRPDTNPGYFDGKQFSDRPHQRGTRSRGA
ncbi:MAG: DNA-N1-methyladenine dioxygenase [Ilumatobacteraceae bacterium]|nr:DNA-N1-methyladenine dioxygenase [Ilumatobacteraceae bacterium]